MNTYGIAVAMLAAGLLLPAVAAADVGVSIQVGQPGFYGRIDIGDYPRPRLIYAEPVLVQRVKVRPAPVYLHVPPGHEKHWSKHCAKYDACGRPVYFVRDTWYNEVYVPAYRNKHGGHGHDDHGHGEHGHGPGKGHGNGKGKGKDHGKGHD